jgi:RNA polymerase sigma-70 factor, ECF subfamily
VDEGCGTIRADHDMEANGPGDAAAPAADSTFSLLQRARAGDRSAVDRLFSRYLPRLQRWARGRLPAHVRDLADTQDLVQESLIQTFTRLEQFEYRGEGALQAYLRQVLLNRIRMEVRKAGRRPASVEFEDEHRDEAPSPLEQAIGREGLQRYEAALERLRPQEREAIIARFELGMSYDEVAAALEKRSVEAARKTTERAVRRLIEEMAGE